MAHVCFHCIERQVQFRGYFGVGEPLRQLFQHAYLGGGQRIGEFTLLGSTRGALARLETDGDQCRPLPGPGIKVRVGDHMVHQQGSCVHDGLGETVALSHGQGLSDQGRCVR